MTNTRLTIKVTQEIQAAIQSAADDRETTISDLCRELILRGIKRRDLIETMPPRGRPKDGD